MDKIDILKMKNNLDMQLKRATSEVLLENKQ